LIWFGYIARLSQWGEGGIILVQIRGGGGTASCETNTLLVKAEKKTANISILTFEAGGLAFILSYNNHGEKKLEIKTHDFWN
jgi:hypothetical protein